MAEDRQSWPTDSADGYPPAPPAGGVRPTIVRYLVLLILSLAAVSAYITRSLGAVNTTIRDELQFNNEQMGLIVGAFSVGYLWMQVPGGWLGTRFGVRGVLALMAVCWSASALWMSQAVDGDSMYWSRIAVGLAQGGMVPCMAKAISEWIPASRRGIASSAIGTSMQVGALAALWPTADLASEYGWRTVYFVYSQTGVVWAMAFWLIFRETPARHPWTNAAERELIAPQRTAGVALSASPAERQRPAAYAAALVLGLISSLAVWALCSQAFCRAFAYDFFLSYCPAYLEEARGLPKLKSSVLTMPPIVGVALGSIAGGAIVDWLFARTRSRWISRSAVGFGALVAFGVCFFATSLVHDPNHVVAVLTVGTFFFGMSGPAAWAAMIDISGRQIAVVSGLQNMTGNAGSYYCARSMGKLFDYIRETPGASWNLVLYVFVAINALGAACFLALNPSATIRHTRPAHDEERG